MPSISDVFGSLRRRSSQSIRSISSGYKHKRTESYQSYTVYEQIMSPVIRVLGDTEVTERLLEAILDSPGGRRSLSRLARTCKAFLEPALNALWRDLPSLLPLIGLFPGSLLKKARRPGLGLTRTPVSEDWKRLLQYGQRVRKITYNEAHANVAVSIFPILENNKPTTYILPHIREVVWRVESQAGLQRCSVCMGPELESLTLEVGMKTDVNHFLLDASSRTKLKEFSLSSPAALPESFTELLAPQNKLQKVTLVAPGALAPSVGKWLASLHDLKTLQLDLSGRGEVAVEGFFDELHTHSGASTPSSVMSTDSGVFSGEEVDFADIRKAALRLTGDLRPRGSFSSLRRLNLTGDVGNMTVFMKHLASDIVHLDLVIEDPPDAADWQDMTALVSQKFEGLQSLRITATATSRYTDLVRSTNREAPSKRLSLVHLAALSSLARLEIDLPESFLFTKADIAHLASVAPMLQEVRLCPLARFPLATGPPTITLEDVVPLLESCPRLHTLAVVVNAKRGSAVILDARSASSKSLLRLHVGHSWIGDGLHVAILLSHLAPHLETLKWFHEKNRPGYVDAHARAWESVAESFLPALQGVRLSERKFAAQILESMTQGVPVTNAVTEYSEQEVDATVLTEEFGVQVYPEVVEMSVQFSPVTCETEVNAVPRSASVSIDATPMTTEMKIDACPEVMDESVEAATPTTSQEVDATVLATPTTSQDFDGPALSVSKSVEALVESTRPSFTVRSHLPNVNLPTEAVINLVAFMWRVAVFFPITLPFNVLHTIVDRVSSPKAQASKEVQNEIETRDIALDAIPVRDN